MSLPDLSTPVTAEPNNADIVLLEGPRARVRELGTIFRVAREFIRGFRILHFVGPCVTIFGSARLPETHPAYAQARELGAAVSRLGFTVMTGGGPGVMEAANRGARDVGGPSVGSNIELPFEQDPNPYMDRSVTCRYFFVRKVLLFKYSYAFVALPGGLGTLDELTEALTLIQTGKIKQFPVVLMGVEYLAAVCRHAAHHGPRPDHLAARRRPDARDRFDSKKPRNTSNATPSSASASPRRRGPRPGWSWASAPSACGGAGVALRRLTPIAGMTHTAAQAMAVAVAADSTEPQSMSTTVMRSE